MSNAGGMAQENKALRQRLSRLSEASLRINESLDFGTVLQGVLDSARSLTGARYGVITLLDDGGRIQDFLYSGLTPDETRQFAEFPNGMLFFERLSSIGEPLRLRDFHGYARALGLPEFRPPMAVSSPLPFLASDLLILDDLGLHRLTAQQSADLYELILNRHRTSSFVITSNRAVEEWLGLLDDPILGNSALDRLANASYQIVIEGSSYRERLSPHRALLEAKGVIDQPTGT